MAIERKRFRGIFSPTEIVKLKQVCFTPNRVFQPGNYPAADLPDIAFDMGFVEALPPSQEKSDQTSSP